MTSRDRHDHADDLDVLLAALPPEIVAAIHALPDRESLIEVVLDLGRQPEARYPSAEVTLLEREITERDIAHVVEHIGSSATTTAPASSARCTASPPSATAAARSSA